MGLFTKKKVGIAALKEKLEAANKNLIEAQLVMNEFYALLLNVEQAQNGIEEVNK